MCIIYNKVFEKNTFFENIDNKMFTLKNKYFSELDLSKKQ